jgi:peptide/nickel transport system substrate-binding protein
MGERSVVRTAVIVLVAAVSLGACTSGGGGNEADRPPSEDSGATPSGDGGVVRIGWGGAPDSLNPGNGLLGESYTIYELVYDTLVSLDLDGSYQPSLATSWTVSDDERTWTLELVDGATFHDGEPLTASDVRYSLELWRDTDDFPFLSSYPDAFVDIQAPDDRTLTITTEEPIGNLESRLVFAYIVPEHVWSAVDDVVEFDNAEMVGSGPFVLTEHQQGE